MNSSFSKKRHITEANSVLESRFINDKILAEQAIDIYSDWGQNFPCMTNKTKKKRPDNSTYYEEGANTYYGNGRMQVKVMDGKFTRYYWYCDPSNTTNILYSENANDPDRLKSLSANLGISAGFQAASSELPGASNASSPDSNSSDRRTLNQTLQWKDCSKKGVYQLGCMDPRPQDQNDIKKIQGCIGVKQDGYFGERTMKTLNKKFPNLGGVARVSDINTICQSQITPVGQSGDNTMELDPKYKVDNPVKAPVVNPNTETQPPEDWVETPQSSPAQSQTPETPETPAPQLDPKQKKKLTDQYRKLAEKYSSERAKILKKTPTATDDQIKQQLKPLLDELNRIYQQIK